MVDLVGLRIHEAFFSRLFEWIFERTLAKEIGDEEEKEKQEDCEDVKMGGKRKKMADREGLCGV